MIHNKGERKKKSMMMMVVVAVEGICMKNSLVVKEAKYVERWENYPIVAAAAAVVE